MQLHRIRLVNFRQHADTELEFDLGITGIIGPNGAGKTTILEAVAWAFYGVPAARGNRDSLRWNRAPARSSVRVEVDFSLGAHEYRVQRGLNRAELYQDRGKDPVATGQQTVCDKVTGIIGMDRDEFFSTYFTKQRDLEVLSGPAAERARFLSRVLGYERLKVAQELLRGEKSNLRGELTGLEQGLADLEELQKETEAAERLIAKAEETVRDLERQKMEVEGILEKERPIWEELSRKREDYRKLEGERLVAEKDVVEVRARFKSLDRELAESLSARERLKVLEPDLVRVAPLRKELEELEREAKAAGRRRALLGQLGEARSQLERLERKSKELSGAEREAAAERKRLAERRKAFEAAERAEDQAQTSWVRDRQDAETKLLSFRDQYAGLAKDREAIVEAGPEGQCPACTRPLGEEYQKVLDALQRQLEEIELNGKYFKQRLGQLEKEPPELVEAQKARADAARAVEEQTQRVARAEARIAEAKDLETDLVALRKHVADIEKEAAELPDAYDAERHDRVKDQLSALDPIIQEGTELRVRAEKAEELVVEAESCEKELSEREDLVKGIVDRLEALEFREEDYREAEGRFAEASKGLSETNLQMSEAAGDLKVARAELAAVQRRVREREAKLERITATRIRLRLHEELDVALRDLRNELNARMGPEISELASQFLSDLTDGRYHELELNDRYEVTLLEDGLPKPVISGGEEDITNIVLRLAISQMVAERAGQPLSLLVLDEIFGTLDEYRRQNVVTLLRKLADRFAQVILITHIETVRDSVDRVLRVSIDPETGAARVKDENGGPDGAGLAA